MSISQNFPDEGPSLNLNFASSRKLDPRITFTRTSTATYTDKNGLVTIAPADTPRFDHSYNGSNVVSLGLLVEESRSNNVLYSQSFIDRWDASFTSGTLDLIDIVGTDNTTTSPDGTTNAATLTNSLSAARATSVFAETIGTTKNSAVTFSCFLKSNTTSAVNLELVCNTNVSSYVYRSYATFTLTGSGSVSSVTNVAIDGSTPSGTAFIQQYPNGWYRCMISFTTYNGANSLNAILAEIRPNSGSASGSIYAWGRQLEAGAFPTSYIPTTSATVTRSTDNASITGTNFSSWYNSTEGTLFAAARINALGGANYPGIAYVDDGTVNNCIGFYINDAGSDNIGAEAYISSVAQYGLSSSATTANQLNKVISAYKVNDFAATFNIGSNAVQTDTSGSVPTVNRLIIGLLRGSNAPLNGTVAQILYYPQRLTNFQLQNLTK